VYKIALNGDCRFLEYQPDQFKNADEKNFSELVVYEVSTEKLTISTAKRLTRTLKLNYPNSQIIIFQKADSNKEECTDLYTESFINNSNSFKKVRIFSANKSLR
jgi:Zn-dependent metalloprotease